jgi:HEAT repeat protein
LKDASDFADEGGHHRQGVEAMKTIGTNALPSLIRMLRAKDSQFKLEFLKLAGKQNLVNFDFERASDLHIRAAYGCSILQSQAAPAIPALVELLPEVRDSTVVPDALVRIGPDGVLALTSGLTNNDTNVRYNVATALADIGIWRSNTTVTPEEIATLDQDTTIAVPALLKLLNNTTDPARAQAALTLGVIGAQAEIVVPALIATLQDANNSKDGVTAAIFAAKALGKFGHEAEGAVSALVVALKSPWAGLQEAAATSLKRIDPEAAAEAGVR